MAFRMAQESLQLNSSDHGFAGVIGARNLFRRLRKALKSRERRAYLGLAASSIGCEGEKPLTTNDRWITIVGL
jgi:hypothetical protein